VLLDDICGSSTINFVENMARCKLKIFLIFGVR
jgi:hypothetical protein